jgi:hypothetical protein
MRQAAYIIFIVLLLSCNKSAQKQTQIFEKSDLIKDEGLKDSVERIEETHYNYDTYGKKNLLRQINMQFNVVGNRQSKTIIENTMNNLRYLTIYKYNTNNQLISELSFKYDTVKYSETNYTYHNGVMYFKMFEHDTFAYSGFKTFDRNGNNILERQNDSKNRFDRKTEKIFNDKDKMIACNFYFKMNKQIKLDSMKYEYNTANEMEAQVFFFDGKPYRHYMNHTIYDKRNNWTIEATYYGTINKAFPSYVVERKIIYKR